MLSRRLALQWVPEPASEPTSTYVITSPGAHFVDIRIFNSSYPTDNEKSKRPYAEVFDWVLSGLEEEVEGTNEIKFVLEIDSIEIENAVQSKKPLNECRRPTDLGFFFSIPDSEDRKETGNMLNVNTGLKQDYVEIWRSLDPVRHSVQNEVREPAKRENQNLYVLVTDLDQFEGKVVKVGHWMQGLVHDKESHAVHVVRGWYNPATAQWEYVVQYGNVGLFVEFCGSEGDELINDAGNVTWKCIEKTVA